MTSDAKLLDRLAERWQRDGVALRPGLSGSMVRLPAGELVRVDVLPGLLRRFDGFEGDASDADGFRFWSPVVDGRFCRRRPDTAAGRACSKLPRSVRPP